MDQWLSKLNWPRTTSVTLLLPWTPYSSFDAQGIIRRIGKCPRGPPAMPPWTPPTLLTTLVHPYSLRKNFKFHGLYIALRWIFPAMLNYN
ncbi:hypothetical protein T06_4236 [Trichinella sp. T6]|nr:hypothetical protein T06_4236 [Trichinella sp. T6]